MKTLFMIGYERVTPGAVMGEPPADIHADHLRHVRYQLAGAEALEGAYPFTQARSVKAFRVNRFLHDLINVGPRAAFLANEEKALEYAGLTEEERDLIRRRDWRGMMHYGVSFFMLEKLGAVTGGSNLHIYVYAAIRGETLEQFQKTRNAPGALYSVAGKETPQLAWDKEPAT